MNSTFLFAMLLTTLAGLSTTLGSIISIFYRKPSQEYMAFTMGFSAGIMVMISFVELLRLGIETIGFIYGNLAFFMGMGILFVIDVLLPHIYILEKYNSKDSSNSRLKKASIFVALGIAIHNFPEGITTFVGTMRLKKASIFVALGIAIHNFPEGITTFVGTMKDIDIGIALAVAIALHNIPEGIAVSVPVYAVTGSTRKAFLWSFLSGISEPIGAFIAGIILMPFLNDTIIGWMLSMVGGFMVFIAFDELLPVSQSYRKEHISIIGVMVGMILMSFSLALL